MFKFTQQNFKIEISPNNNPSLLFSDLILYTQKNRMYTHFRVCSTILQSSEQRIITKAQTTPPLVTLIIHPAYRNTSVEL